MMHSVIRCRQEQQQQERNSNNNIYKTKMEQEKEENCYATHKWWMEMRWSIRWPSRHLSLCLWMQQTPPRVTQAIMIFHTITTSRILQIIIIMIMVVIMLQIIVLWMSSHCSGVLLWLMGWHSRWHCSITLSAFYTSPCGLTRRSAAVLLRCKRLEWCVCSKRTAGLPHWPSGMVPMMSRWFARLGLA